MPALLVVVAFCFLSGYVLLMPGDYALTGRSGLFALAAASNFFFLNNTGYFDTASEFMPLVHTWSLGVEEQFYVVWPLLLAALYRLSRGSGRRMAAGVICTILVSFAVNLWLTATAPKAAFFLPYGRAWELSLGALLALLPPLARAGASRWFSELLCPLGLLLIAWAGLMLSQNEPYPGFPSLLPVLGAALVIYETGQQGLAARLLAAPPLVFVGKISYSLYLWHWPLIVLWRQYADGAALSPREAVALGACSVLVGWLSWRCIEQPFRRAAFTREAVFGGAAVAGLAVAAVAVPILLMAGFPNRIPQAAQALQSTDVMWAWKCPQDVDLGLPSSMEWPPVQHSCVVGANWPDAERRAVMWGDSNAQQLLPLLYEAGRQERTAIALVNPCPAILGTGDIRRDWPVRFNYSDRCTPARDAVMRKLRGDSRLDGVILAARWSNLLNVLFRHSSDQRSVDHGLQLLREGLDEVVSECPSRKKRSL